MRRLLSAVLSLALVGLSAGLEPYAAWAQLRVEAVPARSGLPGVGVGGASSLGQGAGLGSPLPAAVSLNGVLPVTPSPSVVPFVEPAAAQAAGAQAVSGVAAAAASAVPAAAPAAPIPAQAAIQARTHASAAAPSPISRSLTRAAERTAAPLEQRRPQSSHAVVSAEAQAADASIQFDGAARRAGEATAVPGAEALGRARPVLARARTPAEAIAFSDTFAVAVLHRSKFKGKDRWGDESWQRLARDAQRFLTGQTSSAVLTKRGPAVGAGVFKFKWGDQDLRVFARYDASAGRLTFLDLRTKEQLLRAGEDAFYDHLAAQVTGGRVRLLDQAAAAPLFAKLGTLRPGAAVDPVFRTPNGARGRSNGVAEEGTAREGEPAAAAPAPLLEGRLDPATLRLPLELRLRRAAALGTHYALLVAVPVILGAAFGLAPLAVGVASSALRALWSRARPAAANGAAELNESELARTRALLLRLRRGEAMSDAERAALAARAAPIEQLLAWAEGTVEYLVGRAGLDPQRAPRVWIEESSPDLHWAASVGGRLDRSGAIYLGAGFVLRPLSRAVGVLAHEMGHLFFGDAGWLREKLRMRGGLSGGFDTGMRAAGAAVMGAMLAYGALHAALFAASPALMLTGLAWGGGALLAAAGGLLAGLAATRLEELRADHFSGWLSDPAWLAEYLSEEAGRGREPRGPWRRWADHILSTHPAWETRVERLARMRPPAALPEAVLPAPDSLWGLSGEAQAVVTGAREDLAVELQGKLGGLYDLRLYKGGADGLLVVRAHPADGARLDASPDARFDAALAAVLAERYPGARVTRSAAWAHPAFAELRRSALGRGLLAELAAEPIAVRWETSWPADGPRAALSLAGPRPEILLNPAVYWKASPKAVAAALAHELFHYKVWRRLRAAGIPWLDSGGLEFERLAQGVGYRVFAELGGRAADDVPTADGRGLFLGGLERWARADHAADLGRLKEHGYGNIVSLAALRAEDPAGLAANVGNGETAESVRAKLAVAASLEAAERGAERAWMARHPLTTLGARLAGPRP